MNWKQLIEQLHTVGLNQMQIAEACGCTQPTISDLKTGRTKAPTFKTGVALQQLHHKNLRRIARVAATKKTSEPLGQVER